MHRLPLVGFLVALEVVSIARAAAQAPSPQPAPVRVGGAIKQPRKVKDVKPVYPSDAQAARVQGLVIVEATIDPAGKIGEAKVLRSIPMLDAAAIAAVKQWEYTPTLVDGVAVPVIMTVTVSFTLYDPSPNPTPPPPPGAPQPRMVVLLAAVAQNGKRYVFEITPERAEHLPRWDQPSTGEPPLPISDARRLATTWIKGKAPQADAFELAASSLVRARPSASVPGAPVPWYYSVAFDHTIGDRRVAGGLESLVVVLLDGSIVEPRTEESTPVRAGQPGVTSPLPIFRAQPNYTSEAIKARIQAPCFLRRSSKRMAPSTT
jgi:TonB family protein